MVFTLLRQHSGNGSLHYVFMDWRHLREILTAGYSAYDELKNLCVWVKDNAGMGSFYRSRHELALLFKHGDQPAINNIELGRYGRYRSNVWEYAGINSFAGRKAEQGNLLALHPTVKPVRMLEDAIKDASHHGGLVLDPFLGSGSTLIAAERAKRRCYGIEIDPLYVDTILKRWEDHTGGSAVKLASLADLTVGGSHGS